MKLYEKKRTRMPNFCDTATVIYNTIKVEDLETVAELVLSSSSSVSARSGRRLVRPAAAAAASGTAAAGSPAARSRLKSRPFDTCFLRYISIFVKHRKRLGKKYIFIWPNPIKNNI